MSAVMVSMAVLIRTFSSGKYTHPVFWNCAYHLRMELSDGGCFPNLVRNCCWTIVPRQSFWITLFFTTRIDLSNWTITLWRHQIRILVSHWATSWAFAIFISACSWRSKLLPRVLFVIRNHSITEFVSILSPDKSMNNWCQFNRTREQIL